MTLFFLGNRLLGQTNSQQWWSDTTFFDNSNVLVCPHCGDAWGRVIQSTSDWLPVRAGCPRCPSWLGNPPGTFIPSWLHQLGGLPPEVLLYEFNLRYEREFPNEVRNVSDQPR